MYGPTAVAGWPLERALFALAGSVTLVSVALVALVSPWFLAPASRPRETGSCPR